MTRRLPDNVGRYEVRGTIGAGGMGDVYRVFDPVTRRELALKVLKFSYPRALHYFKREFRSVARLQHPNLVRLHDLHREGGRYFFTMELVDGVDLYVYVNGHDRLVTDQKMLCKPERVTRVRHALVQLLRALAFLHDHQCIHRDIKPSNILVDTSGRVRFVDFGIVKELLPGGEGQSLSQVFGTSTYFSPEQSLGSRVTAATDLYAVGVVLYELLSGTPPFEGDSADVAAMHREQSPPSLVQRVPAVAPDLALVCMELLSKDPAHRPSAREALEMLDAEVDPVRTTTDFVGRRDARKQLHAALEQARAGEGRVVLIEGLSGTGKSALVEAFGQQARLFGASTFSGACVPRDHVELRGLDTVVERLAEAYRKQTARILRRLPMAERAPLLGAFSFLAELLPANEHGDPSSWAGGGLLGLSALLSRLSEKRLLILAVEHAHLADDATFDVLEALSSDFPPVLLILSLRPDRVLPNTRAAAFLEVVRSLPNADRIELGNFSLEETRKLLEDQLEEAPGWLVEHVHGETAGLPMFVAELAAELKRNPGVKPTLTEIVARRVQGLDEDARRVLTAVTISPRGVPGLVLERACHLDGDGLFAALNSLEMADLVRTEVTSDGRQIAVPVQLDLLAVARQYLASDEARTMHEMLARAYQASGGTAADLEYHWTVAGKPERAPKFALTAAHEARSDGQHARAAELLALALKTEHPNASRTDLLSQLADSLTRAGRYLQAARALEVLEKSSDSDASLWRGRKCQLYLMAGDVASFDTAATGLPESARVPLADLLTPLDPGRAEVMLGDGRGAAADLVRARLLAGRQSGRSIAEAGGLVRDALQTVKRTDPERRAAVAIAEAVVLRAQGDLAGAADVVAEARVGLAGHELPALRLMLGQSEIDLARGRVSDARAIGRVLLRETRARGLTGLQARACIQQANTLLEAGLFRSADHLLDEAARCLPREPVLVPHLQLTLTRAAKRFYTGRLDDAARALADLQRNAAFAPLLARRGPAGAYALLQTRLCAAHAIRTFEAGDRDPDSAALRGLRRACAGLEQAVPRPNRWLHVFSALDAHLSGRPEEAGAKMERTLMKPEAPLDNPRVEALSWTLLAAALRATGADDGQALGMAATLRREVGSAASPEALHLGVGDGTPAPQ